MNRKNKKNIFVWIILGSAIVVAFAESWKNENAKECKNVYDSFLENKLYKEDFNYPEEVRYEFVYIDKDNIPELLLAEGTSHASKVYVYTYNERLKQIDFLASFSSFGKLGYVPKKNTLISQYGNHGYYYTVYSEIKDNKVKLKEIVLSDGSKEENKWYGGFYVNEAFTGGFGKLNEGEDQFDLLPEGTEEFQISEEDFEKLVEELEKEKVEVSYDEMKEFSVDMTGM